VLTNTTGDSTENNTALYLRNTLCDSTSCVTDFTCWQSLESVTVSYTQISNWLSTALTH